MATKVPGYALAVKIGDKIILGLVTSGFKDKPSYEEILHKEHAGVPDEELENSARELTCSGQTYRRTSAEVDDYEDYETIREAAAAGVNIAFSYYDPQTENEHISGVGKIIDFSEDANSKDIGTYSFTIKEVLGSSTIEDDDWSSYCTPQWLALKLQEDISIWNNIDSIWLFARRTDTDNYLTELKGSGRNATKQGTGNLYFDNQYGVFADGNTALNLNHNPNVHKSALALNSASIGYYVVDEIYGSAAVVGVYDGSSYLFGGIKNSVNGRLNFSINSPGINYKMPTSSQGFILINKDESTEELFIEGISLGTATRASTAIPNKNIWALLFNNNDGAIPSNDPTLARLAMILIGGKWTSSQVLTLNAIFQEYFTGIGTTDRKWLRSTPQLNYKKTQWVTVYQDGDRILARAYGRMRYSNDKGQSWTNYNFVNAGQVAFGYIWDNGNINFATYNKVYFSSNGLLTVSELTVKDVDGVTDYIPHTPANGSYPGEYFRVQQYPHKQYFGTEQTLVIGNYGNVQAGAAPINVYHFYNNGANVKLAYKFGQNPYYRDNGTATGGATGTLLGDAGNSNWCRHVHIIQQDPASGIFYMCTGDSSRVEQNEVKWFTGTYNSELNQWSWVKIYEAAIVNRMKAIGLVFVDGYIWWGSDDTEGTDYGIYRCAKNDIANLASHQKMYLANNQIVGLDIANGKLIATKQPSTGERHPIITSNDLNTFTVTQLTDISGNMTNFYPIMPPDSEGYFCLIPFSSSGVVAMLPPVHVQVK
ncbi:MAG: hypothetical protein GT597_13935 [Bacteroidales bacterium]|nr:hypothetical protein [Bacteroidales bacterium]